MSFRWVHASFVYTNLSAVSEIILNWAACIPARTQRSFFSNTSQPITETRAHTSPAPACVPFKQVHHLHSQSCHFHLVPHFWYIYLPSAGISHVCWHKWLHGSRGSSPTRRVCLDSFGVCTAQTSQAAGLGSVSHPSIFHSSGWQICFNTSV